MPRFSMLVFAATITATVLVISTIFASTSARPQEFLQLHAFRDRLHGSIDTWLPAGTAWSDCTLFVAYQQEIQLEGAAAAAEGVRPLILQHTRNSSNGSSPRALGPFYPRKQRPAPCTIAHYFISPSNLHLLPAEYIRALPGGIFKSFHVLHVPNVDLWSGRVHGWRRFEARLLSATVAASSRHDEVSAVPLPPAPAGSPERNLKMMHHFVILSPGERIYTYNTWFNSTIELDSTAATRPRTFFPDKWHNLGGHILIGSTPDTTQAQMDDYARTRVIKRGGYAAGGMFDLLLYLNTTPRFAGGRDRTRMSFGSRDPATGRWSGLMGLVLEGKAVLSFGIGLTHERAKALQYAYSRAYHFDKVVFLTPLPSPGGESAGSLDFLSRPFQGAVWAAIGGAFLAVYAILFVKKHVDGLGSKYLAFVLLNILLRPVADQPSETPSLQAKMKDTTTRLVMTQWLLAIIVLSCGYKSSFISLLLAPTVVYPPKTFTELVASDYVIGATIYNDSYIGPSFRALNNSVGREVDRRAVGYSIYDPGAYLPVADVAAKQVCIGIQTYLEMGAATFLTSSTGKPLAKISEESLFPISAAIMLPPHFPHFLPILERILARKFEMRLLHYGVEKERRFRAGEGRNLAKLLRPESEGEGTSSTASSPSESSTSKNDLQGLVHFIVVLGFGLTIATGVFLLEIGIYGGTKGCVWMKSQFAQAKGKAARWGRLLTVDGETRSLSDSRNQRIITLVVPQSKPQQDEAKVAKNSIKL